MRVTSGLEIQTAMAERVGSERDHATDGGNTTINPNRATITLRNEG